MGTRKNYVTPLTMKEKEQIALGWGEGLSEYDIKNMTRGLLIGGLKQQKEQEEKDLPEWIENIDCTDVPKWMIEFWKKWDKDIKGLSPESKEKITSALARMKIKASGDRFRGSEVQIQMGEKTLKLWDWNFYDEIQYAFKVKIKNSWIGEKTGVRGGKNSYKNSGIQRLHMGNEEGTGGYFIARENEMKKICAKLGEFAGIDDESDQIAMLMCLTGMYGIYWMGETNVMICSKDIRAFLKYRDLSNFDLSIVSLEKNSYNTSHWDD